MKVLRLKMTYVQIESQTKKLSLQKTKLKSGIWDRPQKRHHFSKVMKYDKQRIFVLGSKWHGRVDSCLGPA